MYLIISGYQFTELSDLPQLQRQLLSACKEYELKGTILISSEGININLVGKKELLDQFILFIESDQRLNGIQFHQAPCATLAFKRLKVKIKKEIITFKEKLLLNNRAKSLTPVQLKNWLDHNKDFTLLDTRNDYEISFGTFVNSINLKLKHFTDFPQKISHLNKNKPVVMFCTGGIRCEKAALYMAAQGFQEVYQLDRGILGYFAEVGQTHFNGECFVFDDRIAVTATLFHPHQD